MAILLESTSIQTDAYRVEYDPTGPRVSLEGALRLAGAEEYAPIVALLNQILDPQPATMVLNLQKLEFLNSSGINMLSKFVIKVRQQGGTKLTVEGSQQIPWQGKSLKNLQRLLPSLVLELV
jgi:hypothetical protein